MAKKIRTTLRRICPNCGDATSTNQRSLHDEDRQFQCAKCGMVYRVDVPPTGGHLASDGQEGLLPICPACNSTLVVVGRLGMSCSKCGHVEPREDDHDGSGTGEGRRAQAEMERQTAKVKTYDAGEGRRVTVPEAPKPEDLLMDAIRENFSPEAVAAMAAFLQAAKTKDRRVNEQLAWFVEKLIAEVGFAGYDHLIGQLGL